MLRTFKYILCTVLTAVLLVSCGDGVTLQRYYVDNQESKNFITQDLPISMVKIDKTDFSEEQHEAFNSVSRLNFLGYSVGDTDVEVYKTEISKVKTILSAEKYQDLMEFSDRGRKIVVKYIGDDETADEVVIFGSAQEMGFAIVRILGDEMNPEKMGRLVYSLQNAQVDENQIQDIMNFFKEDLIHNNLNVN
ncbi:DUF4252 domain-containing protein [Seonamhaeicola marinus]|uniref:DUF4252 domain-containing protein n=1 Tax=Seonamhaeicola marinus TaxID=1912246 RepID=A0A5D0JCB9_9FLAO|nr:DUF4252 domain-containing protein [Seonamhaeicola marinus]TYA92217.1 DUF4252 domain-containing protein [Seonamhaeicola marinus]